MVYYVGVDIGGTTIKAGLVSNGKILSKAVVKTQARKGSQVVFNNIVHAIESVNTKKVKGIGVGCPGPLDYEKGIILHTPNLPFRDYKLKTKLKRKFKTKVSIDNDANCFVLAETLHGAGKGCNSVLGITLGTGVGGGIVINKELFHGRLSAGEFGHMTIDYNGEYSKCGNTGCFETMCSARAILRMTGLGGLKVESPKEVYDLAVKGNRIAKKVFAELGKNIGVGLTNLIYAFDPDVIVVGGEISESWRFFSKSMKKEIKERCLIKGNRVIKSKLKYPGIIGAANLI